MAGSVRLSLSIQIKNPERLPEIQARMQDLSPAFEKIVNEWVSLNAQKFNKGLGAESSGAQIDADVIWEPLSSAYITQKRKGYPNWLMVRSGSLMESMTNPDTVFRMINAQDAIFGTPLDPDDAAKVSYNWLRRQVVFLGAADKNMIRRIIQDYLGMGINFESIRKSKGFEALARKSEGAQLDADFENAVDSDTGNWGNG